MSTKHTPGPWKKSGRGVVAKSRMICTQAIADAECNANSRLIIAAPDMLEALQIAYAELLKPKGHRSIDSARMVLSRAIAKATQ